MWVCVHSCSNSLCGCHAIKDTICHCAVSCYVWRMRKHVTFNCDCENRTQDELMRSTHSPFRSDFKVSSPLTLIRDLAQSFRKWDIYTNCFYCLTETCLAKKRMSFVITTVIIIINILRDRKTIINNNKKTALWHLALQHSLGIELTF